MPSSWISMTDFCCRVCGAAGGRGGFGGVEWLDLFAVVDDPAAGAAPDPVAPSRSGLIAQAVAAVLCKIADAIVESEFRARDRRRAGVIRQPEFAAALARLPAVLSAAEVRQLSGDYRVTGTADINSLNLLPDAHDIPAPPAPLAEPVRATGRRFKQFVTQRQMSAEALFTPNDPARAVRGIRLAAILRDLDFPVTRAETEALLAAFADTRRPECFGYAAFAPAVDREDIASPATRAALTSFPAMPAVEGVAAAACTTIHQKLAARNKRIESAFAGAPPGLMPADEFRRRIVDIGLGLQPGEVQALARKYQRHSDDVAWEEFCADVEASRTIGP
jgi:hypothetical protein